MSNRDKFQQALGIFFSHKALLEQALAHSSYLNENPGFTLPSNERLEFLGDALLNFIVAELLYQDFPQLSEGELTDIRARLVCRETLAEVACSVKLGEQLLLGEGEEASGGRARSSNLANALEALIGAIYLDQGVARAKKFILKQLEPKLKKIKAGEGARNYKALLQELIQGQGKSPPVYQLVESTGPDHDRKFAVEVLVRSEVLGKGTGKSKKAAETEAARAAWEKLTRTA